MTRTVILYDLPAYQPSRWPPASFAWPAKDPVDAVLVSADFGRIIGSSTIVGVVCRLITGGTLGLGLPVLTGSIVSMLASGGIDQEVASAMITVTLADGEVIRRCVTLPVIQQGPAPAGGAPLLIEAGGVPGVGSIPLVLE